MPLAVDTGPGLHDPAGAFRRHSQRATRWLSGRSLLSRALAGSVLLAILVAATFVVMLVAVSDLRRSTDVQAESRDVTSETLLLEQSVNQLEESLRAFVVSGNERFLGSWRQAHRNLSAASNNLNRLLADDPDQRRRAALLATLVNRYVTEYGLPLIAIAHVDPAAARAPVATREGLFRDHRHPDPARRPAHRGRSRRDGRLGRGQARGVAGRDHRDRSARRRRGPSCSVRHLRRPRNRRPRPNRCERRKPAWPTATSRPGSRSVAPPRSWR